MLCEFDAFFGKSIDVWSLNDSLTICAEFSIAEVIGENVNDIRFLRSRCQRHSGNCCGEEHDAFKSIRKWA